MWLMKYFCYFLCVLSYTRAFNFFPKFAQVFSDNVAGSYFGYSVLLQAGTLNSPARVIIGSPRSNSTNSLQSLRSLDEPGAVYSCPLSGERCKQFLLDINGNIKLRAENGQTYQSKRDHAWLGAAIDGLDVANGRLVACSPRWINQFHKDIYYLQNGLCYLLEDSTNVDKTARILLPLISQVNQGYYRVQESVYFYALGEAGMSVHIAKNNTEILFGAPGVLQWRGMIGKYHEQQMKQLHVPNPNAISNLQDFGYFGYSISSGKFKRSSEDVWYVGGAPRGRNLYGQVLLYEYGTQRDELKIHYEMFGQQEGEYFGSALAAGDVNGDGADDVIVGSPMYSTSKHYDVGCVYVYLNNLDTKHNFERTIIHPLSPAHGIRFGSAVAVIGDVNKDGYSDVAIGAPYFNEGQGVVFIYMGSNTGISEQYSQKILASEISSTLRGFGSSFSRGVDIDNNSYIDLAVGSYLSSQAVVLKSRPVVKIQPLLKSDRSQISIDVKSFQISACIQYTGAHLPNTLNIKISIIADDFYKRVYFRNTRGTSWEVSKENKYRYNEEICDNFDILVINTQSDFTQPIVFKMMYELVEPTDNGFCATCPVVDKRASNYTTLSIPYETGCGPDNICRPNLKLDAKFNYHKDFMVIGEEEKLDVAVAIRNLGEPAFACKFYAEIPSDITFLKIPDICQNIKDRNNVLLCDMGNPLRQIETKSLLLPLDVSTLAKKDVLTIKLNVTSAGAEEDPTDNSIILNLPLKTEVHISVIGISNPEQFNFIEEEKLKQDNWTFVHQYTVQNLGPSPLDDLELTFLIPQRFDSDESNVIEVYKPEATADGTSMSCRTLSPEGFYINPEDIPTIIEAEHPTAGKSISRHRRSPQNYASTISSINNDAEILDPAEMNLPLDNPAVYTRVQKLIASDSALPEGLPENRTLALGCGEQADIKCMEVRCSSGILKKNSRAMVGFKLLANLIDLDQKREEKDTIVITSHVQPTSTYFTVNKTYTHTLLQGNVRQESTLKWIILGFILGIILLCLIVYGLYRAGFFRRKTQERLMNESEKEETFAELSEEHTNY